jgi:hypothetical protein
MVGIVCKIKEDLQIEGLQKIENCKKLGRPSSCHLWQFVELRALKQIGLSTIVQETSIKELPFLSMANFKNGKNWVKFGSWKESDYIHIFTIVLLHLEIDASHKRQGNAHKIHTRITKFFHIKKVVGPKKALVLLDETGL